MLYGFIFLLVAIIQCSVPPVCFTGKERKFLFWSDKFFRGHSHAWGSIRFLTTYYETRQASRKSGGNDGRCVYLAPGFPGGVCALPNASLNPEGLEAFQV